MLLSVTWYKYSLVVGFLKNTTGPGRTRVRPCFSWTRLRVVRVRSRIARMRQHAFANRVARQDLLFHLAHLLIRELRAGIRESADKKQDKEELLRSLGHLLKPYTPLKDLPFRVAINNFILMETATCCSIHLNEEELLMLWRQVR